MHLTLRPAFIALRQNAHNIFSLRARAKEFKAAIAIIGIDEALRRNRADFRCDKRHAGPYGKSTSRYGDTEMTCLFISRNNRPCHDDVSLASNCVALHAARISGCFAMNAFTFRRNKTALGPIIANFDDMAAAT